MRVVQARRFGHGVPLCTQHARNDPPRAVIAIDEQNVSDRGPERHGSKARLNLALAGYDTIPHTVQDRAQNPGLLLEQGLALAERLRRFDALGNVSRNADQPQRLARLTLDWRLRFRRKVPLSGAPMMPDGVDDRPPLAEHPPVLRLCRLALRHQELGEALPNEILGIGLTDPSGIRRVGSQETQIAILEVDTVRA